jgi:hypothetical protein
MTQTPKDKKLQELQEKWLTQWSEALSDWSPFVQLHDPIWCFTKEDEKRESLSGSFAMIRLKDHSVVISLRQIQADGLQDFGREILAHEIGHHVYCPADLIDNARLIGNIRRGLPGVESYTPYVANLYSDLLINDHLQRARGRDIAGVYKALKKDFEKSNLWQFYMRIYEILWSLEPQTLTLERITPNIDQDAWLGSRLLRVYAKDWLRGAGRFACLCLPYVTAEAEKNKNAKRIWCDALQAGEGGTPDGLTEFDDDEPDGPIHPSEDPELNGLDPIEINEAPNGTGGRVSGKDSGRKSTKNFRDPFTYAEILKASGSKLSDREIAVKYYRERALPYLIPFPSTVQTRASDPLPEGLDLWDPSNDIDAIDWVSTLTTSPVVIPGVTTRERMMGVSQGNEQQLLPLDLYLGVDCSGSMQDPARIFSYPILAGTIISLSALRAGARVKVVLSGEPGTTVSTDDFERNPNDVMKMMLNYLGTGYSFGIHRLAETFNDKTKLRRPVHILIVSDNDIFQILNETGSNRIGWDVAKEAIQICGGGGTYVLQLNSYYLQRNTKIREYLERMQQDGWSVAIVTNMTELVQFARNFSHIKYHSKKKN